jgi:ankyrin repeat protein
VEVLLEAGADVNAPANGEKGFTALQAAALNNHVEVVEILLDAGADVTMLLAFGRRSKIADLVASLSTSLIHVLSENMMRVEDDLHGKTILHWVAELDHKAGAQRCVDLGADVNKVDKYGESALHYAAENGHYEIIQLLVLAGSDLKAKDNRQRTPLDCAQCVPPGGNIIVPNPSAIVRYTTPPARKSSSQPPVYKVLTLDGGVEYLSTPFHEWQPNIAVVEYLTLALYTTGPRVEWSLLNKEPCGVMANV